MAPLLYFIRHGETDWNVEGRLQGQRDVALNELGRRQAVACADVLRELLAQDGRGTGQLDFVASPLSRARETMERMRAALALEPSAYRTDARLLEVSFGAWEGWTIPELRAHDPAGVAERDRDKWQFVPPQGESYALMCERVRAWHAELGSGTVAVAHGGTARVLMAMLGISPPQRAPMIPIEQGAVYAFTAGSMTVHRAATAPITSGDAERPGI